MFRGSVLGLWFGSQWRTGAGGVSLVGPLGKSLAIWGDISALWHDEGTQHSEMWVQRWKNMPKHFLHETKQQSQRSPKIQFSPTTFLQPAERWREIGVSRMWTRWYLQYFICHIFPLFHYFQLSHCSISGGSIYIYIEIIMIIWWFP